ncbi:MULTISPECIES: hypothetical protein [Pseudomonas]|uniref:Uncharacterized protein n=1 Tax=Pseudomonas mosselii TaxID=78327 RepID=A0ABX9AZ55_9PSED|nr:MULTISPECIES: hypothetical protein [Pseudomonas]OWQ34370.1 hypothetical protein CC207_20020 [Pseudomonas sp. DrBHI1]QZP26137.1 hypothetical protein K5H97_25665 [Pseudomonas mosselii]
MDFHATTSWLWAGINHVFSSSLVTALIGAFIGGYFTMRATRRTFERSEVAAKNAREIADQKAHIDRQVIVYNTSQLILVELTTAWDLYSEEYARELLDLEEGSPYVTVWPIGQNPFPLFDSAPECLAELPPDITKQAIRFYMRAKGIISMVEMNNADSEKALDHARTEMLRRQAEFAKQSRSAGELTAKLQELYESESIRVAKLIGMGSTADAMKLVTAEVDSLVADLKLRLSGLPRPHWR